VKEISQLSHQLLMVPHLIMSFNQHIFQSHSRLV